MFITEQHIEVNNTKNVRKRVFQAGIPLANSRHVKTKFTYKEFTLILGVFVAMIIAITLWSHRGPGQHSEQNTTISNKAIPTLHSIVKKTVSSIHF